MNALLLDGDVPLLEALRRCDIKDSALDVEFEDLTHLAALVCGTPISTVTLTDSGHLWFRATVGLNETPMPRDSVFCRHAMQGSDLLVVPDAAADARFAGSPLVTGEPGIRFYAGMPLISPTGDAVGALCVLDTVPRELDEARQGALRRLAHQAVGLLEARRESDEEERFFALSLDLLCIIDTKGYFRRTNPAFEKILGYAPGEMLGTFALDYLHPDDRAVSAADLARVAAGEPLADFVTRYRCRDGAYKSILWVTALDGDQYYAAGRDITQRVQAEAAARESQRFGQSTLDALASQVAVLDTEGKIIAVNKAWREFAAANGGLPGTGGIGADYLAACPCRAGQRTEEASAVARGIRDVIAGRRALFGTEYACHSPAGRRWFRVSVTRFEGAHGEESPAGEAPEGQAPAGEAPVRVVVSREEITECKRLEEALRESEARLAGIVNAATDAIVTIDDSQCIVLFNRAAEQMFGHAAGAVLGRPIDCLLPERYRHAHAGHIRVFGQKGVTSRRMGALGSLSGLRADGVEFPIEASISRIESGGQQLFTVILRDITERRQAEEALRQRAEFQRALLENFPNGSVNVLDRDLRFVLSEGEGLEELGLSSANLMGKTLGEVLGMDYAALSNAYYERVLNGESVEFERSYAGRDLAVSAVPLRDAAGRVCNVLAVTQDVTERRRTERELWAINEELEQCVVQKTAALVTLDQSLGTANSERQQAVKALGEAGHLLQLIIDQMPQAIFWKDRDSHFLGGNSRLAADAGLDSPEQLIGKTDFDMPWARFAAAYQADDRAVMESGDPKLGIEESMFRADGSTIWLRTNKIPLRDLENNVVGVLGSYEDITEQKRAEAALVEARQEADAANVAKSEFLSRMSHELRTPLNAVLGFGQILDKQELSPASRESISYILKGGRHLLDLINEVLDIARVDAGRLELSLEPLALRDVVLEACATMRPLAVERGVGLHENTAELGQAHILADRQRLKQVLINLLSNAIKFNGEEGEVTVFCEPLADGRAAIAVTDTGPGIAAADMVKLFTPFERLNASSMAVAGTGLGLALARRLVTAMDGELSVQSVLGQGTTFTVTLPQVTAPEEQTEGAGAAPEAPEPEGRTFTLLCIEDNPSNLRLIEVLLQRRPNVRLLTAIQGSIGLDLARRHEPDLILLDLNLPDFNGQEVLTRLRQSALTRDIPVVVISADATTKQIQQLLDAGARDYLTKPLDIAHFQRTLDTFLTEGPDAADEADAGAV